MNDAKLVLKFINGDSSAFNEIVKAYKGKMYSFVYKLVQNHEEAEDILQETFIKAYNHLHTLKDTSKLLSWLYSIAANYYYSTLRKKKLKVLKNVDLTNVVHMEKEHAMESSEMEIKMKEAIAKLPKKQKLALVLRCFEGLSYEEIAKVMNISLNSVKVHVSYARNTLRENLGGLYEV